MAYYGGDLVVFEEWQEVLWVREVEAVGKFSANHAGARSM